MSKLFLNNFEFSFDSIRKLNENGDEFWYARDLMPLLGYQKWEQFLELINLAIVSCENLGNPTQTHFFEKQETLLLHTIIFGFLAMGVIL